MDVTIWGNVNSDLRNIAQEGNNPKTSILTIGYRQSLIFCSQLGRTFQNCLPSNTVGRGGQGHFFESMSSKTRGRGLTVAVKGGVEDISDKGARVQGGARPTKEVDGA
ncbi:hypothetical protein BofuT4_P001320.1 [Botrytis cinerea T4]|uniref:Uncharacterized protein n=1 Tax=Botryotinia fuckeliana (strain T4) TaxID=999810 RepID=G2YM37_BOTF4|nr:hypothetical protein BofuT4_P001320.1 [Botrytis cinerea T4]